MMSHFQSYKVSFEKISLYLKLFVFLLMSVSVSVLILFIFHSSDARFEKILKARSLEAQKTIDAFLDHTEHEFQRLADVFFTDERLIEALEHRDRELVYKMMHPLYMKYEKQDSYLNNIHIVLKDKTSFLNVKHNRAEVTYSTEQEILSVAAIDTNSLKSGFEECSHGYFYKIVYPVKNAQNELLGVVEFTFTIENILEDMKNHYGYEMAFLYQRKESAETDKLYKLLYSTSADIFTNFAKNLNIKSITEYQKVYYGVSALNFYDMKNNFQIIVLSDITELMQVEKEYIRNLITIFLFVAVAVIVLLFYIINYYLQKIKAKEQETLEKTEELYFKSRHNHLTSLPSMSVLNEKMNISEDYSVIMLDMDNIAIYNTTYGNEIVDMFIKKAALCLQNNLPSNAALYHLRADEFVIILSKPTKSQARDLAYQIKSYFENTPLQVKSITTHINFSFGISQFSTSSKLNAFTKANIALVEAKHRGRSLILEFEASMSDFSSYTQLAHSIELLQKYIEEDRLVPFYQAIVDTKTQQIVKYEVLARIKDGDRFLSPHEFLRAVELTGLMTAITKQMIQKSFIYFSGTNINFSINVTKNDFLEKNLIKFLEYKCEIYNIKPEQVTLEILENIALEGNAQEIIEQITVLANAGYIIAIDDFGVESSNISRLSDLNANFIKIDGSFIKDIDVNKKHYKIVESLVYMAKKLDIKVIAEYVHSESVYNVVKELDIDYSQGFYFSEPKIGIDGL